MLIVKEIADKDYVSQITPSKVSQLNNDLGYLTSYVESDPSVPSWAKESKKPSYTAEEVGADPAGAASEAQAAANEYTDTKIADLINSAPTTLDTLGEIASAMQENSNVVESLESAIGLKASTAELTSHTSNTSNPHGVTMEQLKLTSETWTFVLEDGSSVTKKVVLA